VGAMTTIRDQNKRIGRLEREIQRQAEAERSHPQHKQILEVIERWKTGTGHPNAKASADRVRLIRARLKDDYTFEHIELAIDGLIANPFRHYGTPRGAGEPSERADQLDVALGSGKSLEMYANLGARARNKEDQ
jgi:hypothetical protein